MIGTDEIQPIDKKMPRSCPHASAIRFGDADRPSTATTGASTITSRCASSPTR